MQLDLFKAKEEQKKGWMGFEVEKINSKTGKEFIINHHYSRGIHNGPICYGLICKGSLVGVIAFANPCSENVCASVFGGEMKRSVIELHRLALIDDTPKNAESWFISRSLKMLKHDHPNYKAVISFADSTQGHLGIIYQASNAIYCGTSGKATFFLDETGRLRHPRQNGKNISKEEAKQRGWVPVARNGKHRYIFLLGSKLQQKFLKKKLLLISLPYPKA